MNHSRSRLTPLLLALAIATWGASALGSGKRMYRWVDEQGNVHYSDQVPADQARPAKSILNERGMTVDHIQAAKTPAQLAEEKRQKQLEQERERQEKEQLSYDRMLMNTFHNEADIVHARDSKIAALENVIQISRNTLEHLEQRQHDLIQQAAQAERAGHSIPGEVTEQIQQLREQIRENNHYIDQKRSEQAEIRKQYEQDIQRWRTIKAEMSQR